MTSINYNEFQAGQGVSAPALNENFTLTNTAIETLETALNTSAASKANKNGNTTEKFSVANATETSHAINLGQLNATLIPVGTVIWFAKNTAPSGYLICNGSAVSRSDYSDLFNIISTTFGAGDGSTTFNLPNLTGKVAYGSTTINESSLETGNVNLNHKHSINAYGAGVGYLDTNYALDSNHNHTISSVGLLPCIKY